ncbi:uncharacterized protein LOC119402201 [Rhipicephalus sanguineus]|uniref:Uncharacterized protein n=1 Tax=Rhipicephalus sanguineus TaxID=34632 RepID=A0A9D4PF84_RHISA|nr:uncharacterized protein LOC119402201 [Rhipicephalus sanguineus]KAH7939373.1 hypothetical protein HPB52_011555 [Rhipicephalus sanguineus]
MAPRGLRRSSFSFPLAAAVVLFLALSTAHRVEARSAHVVSHVASHVVHEPLVAARQAGAPTSAAADSLAPTTTELTEEFDDDDDGGAAVAVGANASEGGAGGAADDADEEGEASPTEEGAASTDEPTAAPTRPSLSNAYPPVRASTPKVETELPVLTSPSTTSSTTTTTTTTTTTRRPTTTTPTTTTTTRRATTAAAVAPPAAAPARPRRPPTTYSAPTQSRSDDSACPRREDIHPCQCIELPSKIPGDVETVATCKNIRNHQVLSDALKGFQHYRINFFVLDSCKLPPFPNGLFHNVDVEWMEVLNSTVQFQKNFFTCSKDCL